MPQYPSAPNSTPQTSSSIGSNQTPVVRLALTTAGVVSGSMTEITSVQPGSYAQLTTAGPNQKVILNRSGSAISVYPAANTQIEGVTGPVVVGNGGNATFIYNGAGVWRVI